MLPLWYVLLAHFGLALNPIVIKGNYMYDSVTKARFLIKGVDYAPDLFSYETKEFLSPEGEDHISDDKQKFWQRDIPFLQQLGVNAVRIYNVDPAKQHGRFMDEMNTLGIYVLIPATTTFGPGVLQSNLASPACYTPSLLISAKKIVKQFAKYNNTLGFVAGNEVGNQVKTANGTKIFGWAAIPCVKALARDLKAFMRSCACFSRAVPLIYAGTDHADMGGVVPRQLISNYLTCGPEAGLDAYGINVYSWCSNTATLDEGSSYGELIREYSNYDIPVILTEFGCNVGDFDSHYPYTTLQRTWKQVPALFGTKMSAVFSGGFAYEYSMTDNDFGMVLLPNFTSTQTTVTPLANFEAYKNELALINLNTNTTATAADWGLGTRCTWRPSGSPLHKPTCPLANEVQQLFDASGLGKENWSPPLPVLEEYRTQVACAKDPMASFGVIREENICYSGGSLYCPCEELKPNPMCSVAFISPYEMETFFSTFCGYFNQFGGNQSNACEGAISYGGKYEQCSSDQKANYLLDIWITQVDKTQSQCCANLGSSKTCDKILCPDGNCVCDELKTNNTECGVSWDTSTPSENIQRFFDSLCGLFVLYGTPEQKTICTFDPKFDRCPLEDKANYLLTQWLQFKKGTECCAPLADGLPCTAICVKGVCACDDLKNSNPDCNVDEWNADTSEIEIQNLFERQCGLLTNFAANTSYATACEQIGKGGLYFSCSSKDKANYILDTWMKVKSGGECCASLSYSTRCRATCPNGVCPCSAIVENPQCHVSWTESTSQQEIDRLFSSQCSLFSTFAPSSTYICDEVSKGGRYEFCTPTERANYILYWWTSWVKSGKECCASLTYSDHCTRIGADTPAQPGGRPVANGAFALIAPLFFVETLLLAHFFALRI